MCLIIYKKQDVLFPNNFKEILENAYSWNKDGLGIAIKFKDHIWLKKDFKKLDDLYNLVKNYVNHELIIHLRLASAGKVINKLNHPFVITDKNKILKKLDIKTDKVLAHNGTISCLIENKIDQYSDTWYLTKLTAKLMNENLFKNKTVEFMYKKLISPSRVIIMTLKKTILYGNWIEENGLLLSNTRYHKTKKIETRYHNNYIGYQNYNWDYNKYSYFDKCDRCQKQTPTTWDYETGLYLCDNCYNKRYSKKFYYCQVCEKPTRSLYLYEGLQLCKQCYNELKMEVK